MDMGISAVVVALITTIGGIVVGFMQAFRKDARIVREENRNDHAVVQLQLKLIHRAVGHIDEKLQNHIQDHREGDNGKTAGANQN